MVVLVFDSKASYLKYATQELGPAAESVSGYYNLMSNRVITFDLTGLEGAAPDGQRVNRQTLIREMLGARKPNAMSRRLSMKPSIKSPITAAFK